MPWGDGTGPAGMGPMTGGGFGYCAGYGAPGFYSAPRGWGLGPGAGRGRRAMYGPADPRFAPYPVAPWAGPMFGRGGGRGRWFGRGRGFGWWGRRRGPWW